MLKTRGRVAESFKYLFRWESCNSLVNQRMGEINFSEPSINSRTSIEDFQSELNFTLNFSRRLFLSSFNFFPNLKFFGFSLRIVDYFTYRFVSSSPILNQLSEISFIADAVYFIHREIVYIKKIILFHFEL